MKQIRPICVALLILHSGQLSGQDIRGRVEDAMKFAQQQLRVSVTELTAGDTVRYPRSTLPNGMWKTGQIRDWTSGFFPGSLWLAAEYSGDSLLRKAAGRWTQGLEPLQFYKGSHDIGFMIFSSYGNGYRLRPSEDYKKVILTTAQTLTGRFKSSVGCIKSWDNKKWQYPVIIDNMMNLEMLFWASRHGGTQKMYDVAFSHAEKTMQNHFRSDGSTYHVIGYDSLTGAVIAKNTHQGYADESVWSRGQAWAIYGFTMSYRFTKDARFLQTAMRAADWFIDHLPADGVPYWDFNAPQTPNEPRDASAAAVAASGLFELEQYAADPVKKEKYLESAKKMLASLCSHSYLAVGSRSHGIIIHAVGNKPANGEIDVSLTYGDYYFLEAAMRFLKLGSGSSDVKALDRYRILNSAAMLLTEAPVTITAHPSSRSAGGLHDYFSEGDYWWPDPKNPNGPYIQRDGESNPEIFSLHRIDMLRFSQAVSTLSAAYVITGDQNYARHALRHLTAWFVDSKTKMNPHLLFAQAIKNKVTGRGTGIIDTIHLIEIARAVEVLEAAGVVDGEILKDVKDWFGEYLMWMTTHPYGIDEREAKNNHGTWWVAQVAAFAHLTNDTAHMVFCRERYGKELLPNQMSANGSFPLELKRTKPYHYSLFNLDGMTAICRILSTPTDDLWSYTLSDGRSIKKGMEFMFPFIADKSIWPYPKDVQHFEAYPTREPSLFLAGMAFHEQRYLDLWRAIDPAADDGEVLRGLAIKQPVLWMQ